MEPLGSSAPSISSLSEVRATFVAPTAANSLNLRWILRCCAAIHFVIDIKDVPEDQQFLVLSLRLEEKRFYSWGEHAGLIVDDPSMKPEEVTKAALKLFGEGQRGFIFDVLAQIQILFENFRKQELRHKRLENVGEARDMPIEALNSMDEAATERRKTFLRKAWTRVATKSTGGWNRLRWINFDGVEVKRLIERFTALNDKVTDLLDSKLQRQIAITTQDTYREVLQLATRLEQFQQIVGATNFGRDLSGSQEKGMRTLLSLARFKFFHRYIEKEQDMDDETLHTVVNRGSDIGRRKMRIPEKQIQINREDRLEKINRSTGVYWDSASHNKAGNLAKKSNVWVEWKNYEAGGGMESAPPKLLIDRAEKLSNLLSRPDKPTEFSVPRCLGYFDNRDYLKANPGSKNEPRNSLTGKIGFVFAPPEGANMNALPKSLLDLFRPDVVKPTVTDRIALAHALANSLMFLHSVDWLHKGLRSDNVLFFEGAHSESFSQKLHRLRLDGLDDEQMIDYGNPILSGFDYARPASKGEKTEGPNNDVEASMYRHPDSQNINDDARTPYCKTFDIYSLGVILVEIAFWMPIDEVVAKYDRMVYKRDHPEWDQHDPQQKLKDGVIFDKDWARPRPVQIRCIKEKLLKKHTLMGVGSEMGTLYQKIVKGCLEGRSYFGLEEGVDEEKPSIGARLSNVYYEKVVRQLEEVKI